MDQSFSPPLISDKIHINFSLLAVTCNYGRQTYFLQHPVPPSSYDVLKVNSIGRPSLFIASVSFWLSSTYSVEICLPVSYKLSVDV